ncbi:hypothetical protein XENOCAPTIV_009874, partial [Xenoophorus captivus]
MTDCIGTQLVSAIHLQEVELQEKPADNPQGNRIKNNNGEFDEQESAEEKFTVEQAVETIGFGRFHILLFVIMGSANMVFVGFMVCGVLTVLSSSELLEKNLLCVMNADEEHQVKHRHESGRCYCIPFGKSDYQTLLISSLGEVAFKLFSLDDFDTLHQVRFVTHSIFSVFPVVPLNIVLLNVFGRKKTLVVLQLLTAVLFMMVNICTTM